MILELTHAGHIAQRDSERSDDRSQTARTASVDAIVLQRQPGLLRHDSALEHSLRGDEQRAAVLAGGWPVVCPVVCCGCGVTGWAGVVGPGVQNCESRQRSSLSVAVRTG